MNNQNRVKSIFKIEIPIIQAGMVWCSGWRLASAVSNSGGLGLIGAGSMRPEILKENIQKCKSATNNSFGVNVPLLYPEIDKIIDIILKEEVKIVFTSAGNPNTWTKILKNNGVVVSHVVSSSKFARKAEDAGVDAIVAEGFEAGGHNGREETTTMVLIPAVSGAVSIPVIAAGGIASGKAILAAHALGAEGVQVGSRFAVSQESSAHEKFKTKVLETEEGQTILTLKQITPVRLIRNKFYEQVAAAEGRCANKEELLSLLGKGRAKKGIFEGDLEEGELEIGQVAASITRMQTAEEILQEMWGEYLELRKNLSL